MIPIVHPEPRARQRYEQLLRLMLVTERIREKGWRVDAAQLERHRATATERVEKFTRMFLAQTGLQESELGAAGTGATHRVRDWFWVVQEAPQVVFDKLSRKPQFSTECLIIYATEYQQEVFGVAAAALYGLRKNKKLLEFCESYRQLSARDGRCHFDSNPAGTQTGRWTSSTKLRVVLPTGQRTTYSGNVQQVPSKTPSFDFKDGLGKVRLVDSLRDIFIPDEGCVLLKSDFDAQELRLIAYINGARKLIEWIDKGDDTHIRNAIGIFRELRLPLDAKKTKDPATEMERLVNAAREAAKPLAYGVSYQMHSPSGDNNYPTLFKTLKKIFPTITEQQANLYAARFFELHPEIKKGQTAVREDIERLGSATLAIDGRRLFYPATMRGFNQALNFRMQATGAALINRAILKIDAELDWQGQELRAQIHDELVVQTPRKDLEKVKALVEKHMSEPAQIGNTFTGIPAEADPGLNWGATMPYAKFVEKGL